MDTITQGKAIKIKLMSGNTSKNETLCYSVTVVVLSQKVVRTLVNSCIQQQLLKVNVRRLPPSLKYPF